MAEGTCSIDGCAAPVLARRMCRAHYDRWYARTHRDQMRSARRKWLKENPAKMAAARAAWDAANPEWWTQRGRDRRQTHPEEKRAQEARRRARKRHSVVVLFTPAQLEQRLSVFGHRCWICGEAGTTIDHVKPLSRGGAHMLCNLRPACLNCNIRKGNRWPYVALATSQQAGDDRPALGVGVD